MSEWQPIETAPKDGSRILGWAKSKNGSDDLRLVIFWDQTSPEGARWIVAFNAFWHFEPTHWMPLPEPPEVP